MKLLGAILILVLGPLGVGTAYADSDGYYCVGRGYIAYQFGFAAPPIGPHRLSVIQLGGASGIQPPAVLDLPQFQVHGMRCGETWIDVAAFTAIYHVILDKSDRETDRNGRETDARIIFQGLGHRECGE